LAAKFHGFPPGTACNPAQKPTDTHPPEHCCQKPTRKMAQLPEIHKGKVNRPTPQDERDEITVRLTSGTQEAPSNECAKQALHCYTGPAS
jgi:hypothetical protein